MKIEISDDTATTLFVALRGHIRQVAKERMSAPEGKAADLQQFLKQMRDAETDFMRAILKAKTEENTQ